MLAAIVRTASDLAPKGLTKTTRLGSFSSLCGGGLLSQLGDVFVLFGDRTLVGFGTSLFVVPFPNIGLTAWFRHHGVFALHPGGRSWLINNGACLNFNRNGALFDSTVASLLALPTWGRFGIPGSPQS